MENVVDVISTTENAKGKILSAAMELFGRKGYEGTSTRDICKLAGVNISMISYYFGGKQELFDALIADMLNTQYEYMRQHVDFDTDLQKLAYDKKVEFLTSFLDKMIDFIYGAISTEQVRFFLKAQHEPESALPSPIHDFLAKIMASIINKDPDDKEVIYRLLFLMSQIAFPRMVPAFSLKILNKNNFDFEDVRIIKLNMEKYVEAAYKTGLKP